MYLPGFAGEDIGPLDHDHCDEVGGLRVEEGLHCEGDRVPTDGADCPNDFLRSREGD